jgi:hypothetical protein
MTRQSLFGIGALLMIIAIGSLSSAEDKHGDQDDDSATNFAGKIVMVIVDRSSALEQDKTSEIFTNAAIRKIGDRYFITGTAYPRPNAENDWRGGAEAGVVWEHVHQYYAYTPEQFKKLEASWAEYTDD